MNKSGDAVARVIKKQKAAEMLVVVHDELDLPLGRAKFHLIKAQADTEVLSLFAKPLARKVLSEFRPEFLHQQLPVNSKADW